VKLWSAAEERSGTAAFHRRSPTRGSSTAAAMKAAASLRYAAALHIYTSPGKARMVGSRRGTFLASSVRLN